MNRLFSISIAIFIGYCLLVATASPAYAYVDPGSGYVALQSIASIAAACGYFFRRRLRSIFFRHDNHLTATTPNNKSNKSA
jgi:hypothetical protein